MVPLPSTATVRRCNNCGNPAKGHPQPMGKKCQQVPLINAQSREAKDRERHKSDESKAKCRERQKTEEVKANCRDRKKNKASLFKAAWTNPLEKNPVTSFTIPAMNKICVDCGAKMFPWELSKPKDDGETFSKCCSYGKVKLQPFTNPSPALQELFNNYSKQSKQFLNNIRMYNGLVAMASKGIRGGKEEDYSSCGNRGPRPFKMSGQMYHRTPSVMFPEQGKPPKYSQIYTYDIRSELDNRVLDAKNKKYDDKIDMKTLKMIQDDLKMNNQYVKKFKSGADIFEANPTENLKMVFKAKGSAGAATKTQDPVITDVCVVAPGDQTEKRDIVLYRNKSSHPDQKEVTEIHQFHPMYDPTCYPLILPGGDDGYSFDSEMTKTDGKKLSELEFYRYHIQARDKNFNTIHKSKRLGQEFLCDQYSKIEGNRLAYLKNHQDDLRVEEYRGLQDALAQAKADKEGTEIEKIGQLIVLPASFTGSPRYMYKHYLDALAIAQREGKFDLFITITGNPNWDGVKENLFPGQVPSDRPDVVNRVFQKVLTELLYDINHGCFGTMKARIHTIEGQFRCLKHAHLLLKLDKSLDLENVDYVIQAQLPDPELDPELYEYVTTYMIHGPCGPGYPSAPCMKDGKCSKGYPKEFNEESALPHEGHGYPIYSRPNNGRTFVKDGFTFDNR